MPAEFRRELPGKAPVIAPRNLAKLSHGAEICCAMTTVGEAFRLAEPGRGGFGFSTRAAHGLSGGNE
jgi:hypothetical protein